jgi:hypothetical protein
MRTVVLERNTDGRGVHRFHPGFLDYARHAGFLPRLCRPFRAQTKGKVERFIGDLKGSFWVPFVATMRQAGLQPDKPAATAAAARGLSEVANPRVHATTNEVPAERLVIETPKLQPLSKPYAGRAARSLGPPAVRRKAIVGDQHPLSVYADLQAGPSAPPSSESVRTPWSATNETPGLPGRTPAVRARLPAKEFSMPTIAENSLPDDNGAARSLRRHRTGLGEEKRCHLRRRPGGGAARRARRAACAGAREADAHGGLPGHEDLRG